MWLVVVVSPIFISTFVAGSLVWLRGVRSYTRLSFVIFSYIATLWMVANFIDANFKQSPVALLATRIDFVTGCWTLYAIWLFAAALLMEADTRNKYRLLYSRTAMIGMAAPPLVASLLSLMPMVIDVVKPPHQDLVIRYGRYYLAYGSLLLIVVIAIAANVTLARRLSKGRLRQQISFMLSALLLSVLVVGFANLALPKLVSSASINLIAGNLSYLGVALFALGTFYSMARHKLFDFNFFIVRAAAYLTSLFVLTLIFTAPVTLVFALLLKTPLHFSQLFAIALFGALTIAVYLRFRQAFDHTTAKIFYRHYYDPQDVLDKLSDTLVRTADIDILRRETSQILADALHPSQLKYILFNDSVKSDALLAEKLNALDKDNRQKVIDADLLEETNTHLVNLMKQYSITLAVRLRTTHEDLGFVVAGYKQSGEVYTERDRRLLSVAADEIAISLQNALRFQEIQQFNITLQQRIEEATRKLRRTNQKLLALDEAKDDFISMASHQLRTPLTSVKGYISMVLDGDAGKINHQQAKMLRQAFSSSQRMVYLITDLLNISRLRTGKFVIDPSPTSLSELAQQEVVGLQEIAKMKDIKLTFERPGSFPKLLLDEVKTRQVIMNFIDNALYYTPPGGHVRVELEEKPAAVELRVVDDGIGVPKSEQHHLFTKFYRASNARKTRPDGTGLGLFMAKKIVAAQGGSTIFSSREGQGSTFGFVFSKTRLRVPDNYNPKLALAHEAPAK